MRRCCSRGSIARWRGSEAPGYSVRCGTGTCHVRAQGCPGSRDNAQVAYGLADSPLRAALLALAIVDEVRTSRLQSSVLTRYAARLTYDIGAGPSSRIVFPSSGPHDRAARLLPPAGIHPPAPVARLSDRRAGADVRSDGAACRSRHRAAVSREGERRSRGPRCRRSGNVRRAARKDCSSSATRTCRRSSSRACSSSRTASCWGPTARGTILRSTGSGSRGRGCCTSGEGSACRSPPKVAARSPRRSRSSATRPAGARPRRWTSSSRSRRRV